MDKKYNEYQREELEGFSILKKLALDFSWSWYQNRIIDTVWRQLDPELWEDLRNPLVVLQTTSLERLKQVLADSKFRKLIDDLVIAKEIEAKTPKWFNRNHPKSPISTIAYFSMEFMLGENLPIYSGGLGNVAGDQLKAANDLGVPVIGIGLLYQQGYFRQIIDKDGAQREYYPFNSPGQLPIMPLRKSTGEWVRVKIELPGWPLWLRAWEVVVGRSKLYLLDSNDAANYPPHRGITSELYGGDLETRLKQELLLGIGGFRLLTELGINPEVCHLNEGHAAFAILERARAFMKEKNVSFEVALTATRAGNIFTTHTSVPAGFDLFPPSLIKQYLTEYAEKELGIPISELITLGQKNLNDPLESFNMAYLAIHGSFAINGVSKLHEKISRHIFEDLFPRYPEEEIPIGHITNGVHMPTWSSVNAEDLWQECSKKSCWLGPKTSLEDDFRCISDEQIWKMRSESRKSLVEYARRQLSRQLAARGVFHDEVESARHLFDSNTLTLGFARRFATYKRPNLLLNDPERLFRILTNQNCPVQIILAGKAHPKDQAGKSLIQEWIRFIKIPKIRPHVIFLSDYDMFITEYLVQGVDVWINTPRRPWEACGTSGMKILANGGLNLSELDGWWNEAYTPEVGWAVGDGQEHGDNSDYDTIDANNLYEILERKVIPEFYERNKDGIPTTWVNRIRESMATLTPRYSADRAVAQYTEKYYIPAAESYIQRSSDINIVNQIISWEKDLKKYWSLLRFEKITIETKDNQHQFEIQVYLNNLNPKAVKAEIYAIEEKYDMELVNELSSNSSIYTYRVSIPNKRPANYYTPRIIPSSSYAKVPLEAHQILWQH